MNLLSNAVEKTVTFISIPESLLYALIGFAVTFLGILVLIICVTIMGKIMTVVNNRSKKVSKPAEKEKVVNDNQKDDAIPEEVIVAITAAISAYYESENSSCEFKVKRIKRI